MTFKSQSQQIVDEIIAGLQAGTMHVENVEVRWDRNVQRYLLQIYDPQRSKFLAAMQPATTAFTNPTWSPPKKEESAIKDLGTITEPIIGFRDFYLGTNLYPLPGLISRNKAPWPMREPMRAFCRKGALSDHDAPKLDCECGIYSFAKPDDYGLLDMGSAIWGEIAMWGEVVIAERGYRAEFAYPKTIFMRDTGTKSVRWLRDHLADGYGVPVLLVEQRAGKTASEVISELLEKL